MNTILIMLSTYNGQKFLREQLDSLYNQTGVNIYILVRDDGSSDDTVEILQEYKDKYDKMTLFVESNIGCKKSFYRLTQLALDLKETFEYYSFCDQDDVWEENKLLVAMNTLNEIESDIKLYYSAANVVNEKLEPLEKLKIATNNTLASSMISSHSLGCTQVFNKGLLKRINKINNNIVASIIDDSYLPQHDTWVSITAKALEGYVYYDEIPYIHYRQHSDNVVGSTNKNSFYIFIKRLKRHVNRPNLRSHLAQLIIAAYSNILSDDIYDVVSILAFYKKSFSSRVRLFLSRSIRTGNLLIDIPMKYMVLIGKY